MKLSLRWIFDHIDADWKKVDIVELVDKFNKTTAEIEGFEKFKLDVDSDTQHYGIGIKELWEINSAKHQPGLVIHGAGWPLEKTTSGGFFLYHGAFLLKIPSPS